jgi:hypothetical protein
MAVLNLGRMNCLHSVCSSVFDSSAFVTVVVCCTFQIDFGNSECATWRKLVICSEASVMVCEN